MSKKLIVFNWKMAPDSLSEARQLLGNYLKFLKVKNYKLEADLVICPPFVYLSELAVFNKTKIKLGAQDIFWNDKGAYTGEISPEMIKNLGIDYVIIGHSERRKFLGETDEMISKKVLAALKAGLKVILCVGEPSRAISKKGQGGRDKRQEVKKAKNYIKKQLEKDLKDIKDWKLKIKNLIVAYEPVWAIGTGCSDTPQDAIEMMGFIKRILNSKFKIQNSKLLYGGSVTGKNIKDFIQLKEMDGVLVGGASLKTAEIEKIIKSA